MCVVGGGGVSECALAKFCEWNFMGSDLHPLTHIYYTYNISLPTLHHHHEHRHSTLGYSTRWRWPPCTYIQSTHSLPYIPSMCNVYIMYISSLYSMYLDFQSTLFVARILCCIVFFLSSFLDSTVCEFYYVFLCVLFPRSPGSRQLNRIVMICFYIYTIDVQMIVYYEDYVPVGKVNTNTTTTIKSPI